MRISAFFCFVLLLAVLARPAFAADVPAVVVVAVPANADTAMLEALHRLRGEATAVGFEVRLVSSSGDRVSPAQLDRLWAESHAAAVVTFSLPDGATNLTRSLDVTFAAHADASHVRVAHIAATDETDKQRADVILAVRVVDFIRARMFDTLVDRRAEPRRETDGNEAVVPQSHPRHRRFHLAAGAVALGSAPGFGPSLTPRIGLGYLPWPWLRARAVALGLGSKPTRQSTLGEVSLDPHFVNAELALLTRRWWRLQPLVALSGGEYWVKVRGQAKAADVIGQTVTRSSPAAALSLGLAFDLGHGLACELYAGTLWLQRRVHVGTETEDLGSLGYPTAFGGLMLNAEL